MIMKMQFTAKMCDDFAPVKNGYLKKKKRTKNNNSKTKTKQK